jgi:hypothetical protein
MVQTKARAAHSFLLKLEVEIAESAPRKTAQP